MRRKSLSHHVPLRLQQGRSGTERIVCEEMRTSSRSIKLIAVLVEVDDQGSHVFCNVDEFVGTAPQKKVLVVC